MVSPMYPVVLKAVESNEDTPRIHMGSHYDTVANAGAYDGTLGVLIALAVAEVLSESGVKLTHDFGPMLSVMRRVSAFRLHFLGSAAVSGQFEREWLGGG